MNYDMCLVHLGNWSKNLNSAFYKQWLVSKWMHETIYWLSNINYKYGRYLTSYCWWILMIEKGIS